MGHDCSKCQENAKCEFAWLKGGECLLYYPDNSVFTDIKQSGSLLQDKFEYRIDYQTIKPIPKDNLDKRCGKCKFFLHDIGHGCEKRWSFTNANIAIRVKENDVYNCPDWQEKPKESIKLKRDKEFNPKCHCVLPMPYDRLSQKYKNKLNYNVMNLGEIGRYISIRYAENILEEVINELFQKEKAVDKSKIEYKDCPDSMGYWYNTSLKQIRRVFEEDDFWCYLSNGISYTCKSALGKWVKIDTSQFEVNE